MPSLHFVAFTVRSGRRLTGVAGVTPIDSLLVDWALRGQPNDPMIRDKYLRIFLDTFFANSGQRIWVQRGWLWVLLDASKQGGNKALLRHLEGETHLRKQVEGHFGFLAEIAERSAWTKPVSYEFAG